MWLYLQWGPLGPVHDTIVEDNYHNQTIAGGCGDKGPHGHFATCPQNLECPRVRVRVGAIQRVCFVFAVSD